MSEHEEEKNTFEGSTQSYGKQQKTPTKFGKMQQQNINSHQYGEIERVVIDKLRKTSSTFSFRDEGLPVVQDDTSQDHSFERNDISVTPCKSPLNQSDNMHYDISDNSIPQGSHNLANSFIKRNLVQNFESFSNQNQSSKEGEEYYSQQNDGYQPNELQNTPQLNGRQSEDIYYPQLNEFHPQQIINYQNKITTIQNDNRILQDQNKNSNQNENSAKANIHSRNQQFQNNLQSNFPGQDVIKPRLSKEAYLEDLQQKPLKVITEKEQEEDPLQDQQSGELEFNLQNKQESNVNKSTNCAIKIVQNQNISMNNSNKDLDNHYWESSSAIDVGHPQHSSTSIHSQKEKEPNKIEQNHESSDFQKQPQIPKLYINSKNIQSDDLPNFKQSELKNLKQSQNDTNNHFLNIQQSADFLFSQQTTPRGDTGNQSPQAEIIQRNLDNQQVQSNRNSEYHNIYQEFLKKEKQQAMNSPQIQEEVARFGASDCSSLPGDESMIGENNNQNQNNTFISNNMSTILQQLNNPSSTDGINHNHHGNPGSSQYSSNSQNKTNFNVHSSQSYNFQKQVINEFNGNNIQNISQQQKFSNENQGNLQQQGKYFPSDLIGSRELATTESYIPTPDQSQLNGMQNIEKNTFQNNLKQRQISHQTQGNIADQGFYQSSFEQSDQNPQSVRINNNFIQNSNGENIPINNNNQNNELLYQGNLNNNPILSVLPQNQSKDLGQPSFNFMQQMLQNFTSLNQINQSSVSPQQGYGPILNELNNSRVINSSQFGQNQGEQFYQHPLNNNEYLNKQDDFVNNQQQQMEFLKQQHAFVMHIMNFYEFHLNKMKQIAIEKSSQILEKDRIIQELQTNRNQDQNFYSIQHSLQSTLDEVRMLKQKEKRLELLIDQMKEDYDFQIHDIKEEKHQISKNKEQVEQKLKEIQLTLSKEMERNAQLIQKIDALEQKGEQLQKDKDLMEDDLNEIIGNLKLESKHKDKKILDQQNQIDILQNKITRLNDEKKEEDHLNQKNPYSAQKREHNLNKSFDDIYYNKIKDDLQEGTTQQQNNYTNYLHYKERGQKSQFGDLLKQSGESSKNEASLSKMYENAQIQQNNTPIKSFERIKNSNTQVNAYNDETQLNLNNKNIISNSNSNQRIHYQIHHQKGYSGDRMCNNNNQSYTDNSFSNNPSSQKQSYNRTPSQGGQISQFNNYCQHYQNNNYYDEIYRKQNQNENEQGQQPFNNYTQSFISYSNIGSSDNSHKANSNSNIPYSYQEYRQGNKEKRQNNYQSQEETQQFNFKQNSKPTLTFPSNQNYENNHQQIRQIEQSLTNLNLEKQQLEAQILKLPIHQKNAQQRLQKHTLEKNLESIEKEINNNRKQLKQLQNY